MTGIKSLCFAVMLAVPMTAASNEFTLEKEEDGIKVSKSYNDQYGVYRVRIETISNSSIDALLKINTDPDNWASWMPKVLSAEFVEPGDQRYTVKIAYESPWPVANRESITEGIISKDNSSGMVKLKFHTVDNVIVPAGGLIRIPYIDGFWEFTPLPNKQVGVLYEVMVDPGGDIPKWMVNMESVTIPYETVVEVLENVENYKDVTIDWLHEETLSKN